MKIIKYIVLLVTLQIISCKFQNQHGHQTTNKHKNKHQTRHTHKKSHMRHMIKHKYVKKSLKKTVTSIETSASSQEVVDLKASARYLMVASVGQELTGGDVAGFVATPEEVNLELVDKSAILEEEGDNMYNSKWDLRAKEFSCTGDMFSGELFMIDKVTKKEDMPKDQNSLLTASGMAGVTEALRLNKVTITSSDDKLTVRDSDKQLIDMVKLDQVYPRAKQIGQVLDDESNIGKHRSAVEALKIRILDASTLIQSMDMAFPNFYCMTIINEPIKSANLESIFDDYQSKEKADDSKDLEEIIKQLYESDKGHDKQSNVHDNQYYQLLTLCHSDLVYLRKWMTFINREKVDCHVEFNRKNMDIGEETETVLNSGATSDSAAEMMRASQARADEQAELEKKKKQDEKDSKLTQDQLNAKELERLTSELGDLNESMDQEEQYSQKEISGMMGNIQNMQSSISNKGEQLQCLENALEIKQEEENTAVIKLLKDEEMSKVKNVISATKDGMKKAYADRIKTLKDELLKQKQGIEAEKGNYDQLMVNLIKGGLKKGDKKKCVFDRTQVMKQGNDDNKIDEAKLTDKMTNACSELLSDNEDAAELQNGLLDSINKCTKKEMFCGECCGSQFGYDELLLRQDCSSDCQVIMDIALAGRSVYSAEVTSVIDTAPHKQMKAKIDAEMDIKKQAAMKSRFKSSFHKANRMR